MADELQPLVTVRRSEGVFEQLRSRILNGTYGAGSRLPNERDLASALGVNRGSVREAVKRLEFLELVEVRHGQGTFVCDPKGSSALQVVEALLKDPTTVTAELLRQLLTFRRDITLQVVARAASHRTQEQVERARALLDREVDAGDDPEAALTIDLEMNALLGEATGNLMYQLVTNLFTKLVQRLGPLYYNAQRDHARSRETHRALLDAVERRDVDGARRIVEVMLDYSERKIMETAARLERDGLIGPTAAGRA